LFSTPFLLSLFNVLAFICGHRFYKKTATGVGGFFSESLLHASKEHLQYFLWYFSAHVLLNLFYFLILLYILVLFPQTCNIMCKISILLFPRIIIVETYYLDLVDVIGCVCLSIFWLAHLLSKTAIWYIVYWKILVTCESCESFYLWSYMLFSISLANENILSSNYILTLSFNGNFL
jgi:hypothetical protein